MAALLLVALSATPRPSAGEVDPASCAPRTMRVTFYTCGEGYAHCLTKRGHLPLPFRTVAVGDRKLLTRRDRGAERGSPARGRPALAGRYEHEGLLPNAVTRARQQARSGPAFSGVR